MNRAADTVTSDSALRRGGPRAFVALALAAVGALTLVVLAAPPAAAQADDEAAASTMTKQERKQAEKDARIREYLRKKEERRILREQRKADARATAARSVDSAAAAETTPSVATVESSRPTTETPKRQRRARGVSDRGRSSLPRALAQAQMNVRASALGEDPTVKSYLELIDDQGASPYQLAAFGNFVAESGLTVDALAYYDVAIRLEKNDPTLWVNMGTLHRQHGDTRAAMDAFGRALRLDPNSAVAHYNMGAVFDESGRYDDAVEAYRTALMLDPSLGDPASNPQAANNDRLLAVKLMLYQEQAGSLGLPLQEVDPNRNGNGMR